jgi:hypothetical protein
MLDLIMSYVPKYILKRMIPADAVKLVGNNLEIKFVNVLSPIQIKTLPSDYLDLVTFRVDGKSLDKNIVKQMVFSTEGKEIPMSNPFAANNLLIPIGMIITLKLPNPGLKKGAEHTFDLKIAEYQKFNFAVTRTVQ